MDSISLQSGATRLARPPVATVSGRVFDGHSALMRRTRPSTASAVPHITPARMQSSVRRPIARAGGGTSVSVGLPDPPPTPSDAERTPGPITPPLKPPLAAAPPPPAPPYRFTES